MRTIQTQVFNYSELSASAQETARENYRNSYDYFTTEHIYNNAATIADILGLDICRTRTNSGNYTPTIYYSGFSSQGDGACFEGVYKYKKGALAALKKHIGNESKGDKELLRIATGLQALQRKYFYRLTAKMKHSGHYYHSGCMACDVDYSNCDSRELPEDELTQLMRDFADWIYSQLESEFDYQNSDAFVSENIVANDYEFLESGVVA